jgi:group I intron endonuclease
MASGVYEIVNLANGKRYVGSSGKMEQRRTNHFSNLRQNVHKNAPLQQEWNQYGTDSFEFVVVCHCHLKELVGKEQERMDMYDFDSLYNLSPKAGSNLGVKCSKQTRERISAATVGRPKSESMRAKMIGNKNALGTVVGDETRKKQSKSKMGNTYALGVKHIGRKVSPETRREMAMRMKEKWTDPVYKANMSIAQKKWRARKRAEKAALSQVIDSSQE